MAEGIDILSEIVSRKRRDLLWMQREVPTAYLREEVAGLPSVSSMREALMASPSGIIAEFKRKSPSKGWIKEEGRADIIPPSYQKGGAAAVSILTDEPFFGGMDAFVSMARRSGVTIPILYKNFVIDPYQLLAARACGASAVLLIAACLGKEQCAALIEEAHGLGLEVLLEMHSEDELQYAELHPDMYGINNRSLGTFHTDVETSFRLAGRLPKDVCLVSESGIGEPDTVSRLRAEGYKGFLIGEAFMKSYDPGEALREFIEKARR